MPSVSNPLEQAIGRGCVECIRILVESSPFFNLDNSIGPDGLLPVHVAAREGHLQVLRYLQSAGACLQGTDSKGSNSLHYAARTGQVRAVRWLLRHNVNSCVNSNLETPLHIASQFQHTEIVSILSKQTGTTSANGTVTPATAIEESKQGLDSGNSSLSSSTNPPTSLTITTGTSCSCTGTINSNSSEEINNYTIRSVNSFFLHPPKSGTSSTNSSNPNSSSFYLHPRLISGAIEEESSYSTNTSNGHTKKHSKSDSTSTTTTTKHNHNSDHSHSSSSTSSSSASSPSSTSGSKPPHPSFRLHSSPTPDANNSKSTSNNSFHLHQDEQHVSCISFQQSLDYSIETTMAPVNNQFVISSPVVVQSESVGEMCKVINKSNGANSSPAKTSSNNNNNKSNGGNGPAPPPPPPPPPLPPTMPAPPPLPSNKMLLNGKTLNSVHSKLGKSSSSTELAVKKMALEKEKVFKSVSVNGVSHQQHHHHHNNNMNSNSNSNSIENDYEDIEEIQSQMEESSNKNINNININHHNNNNNNNNSNKMNGHTILSRVNNNNRNHNPLPPPPPLPSENNSSQNNSNNNNNNNTTNNNNNNNSNNNTMNNGNNKVLPPLKKVNGNVNKVPFIPPQFPTPPEQDQLIKPSEYLKSIKTSLKGTLSHGPRLTGGSKPTNDLIFEVREEEETNAEDEFEEINPEIKIGSSSTALSNNNNNNNNHTITTMKNGSSNNSNNNNNNNTMNGQAKLGTNSNNNGGGGGMIRPEELMKVNLRKTPTIRTKSAPPLGRVLGSNELPSKPEIQSPTYGVGPPPLPPLNTKAAVIAELEQSSQVGGVREWKEELKRRQQEEEKNAVKELAQHYSPGNFVSEVPNTDNSGHEIPAWKRQMLAKKYAERARKEAEEQIRMDAENKKLQSIPPWKRQLLQRRESDGKCQ